MPDQAIMQKIDAFLEKNREEMIAALQSLVRIKSVSEHGRDGLPFGPGPKRALEQALALGSGLGFTPKNFDDFGGSITFSEKDKNIAFWAHLDVVPEGENWTYPPYEAVYRDGFVIGRGSEDNKAAVATALYVMKFLKEQGTPLRYGLSLMLGCDEEKGMSDIPEILKRCGKAPALSLVPDTGFPVCYGEKGIYETNIGFDVGGSNLVSFVSGLASNVVPDRAEATVKNTKGVSELPKTEHVSVKAEGDCIHLTATGVTAHAATPEQGINAIGELTGYLLKHELLDDSLIPLFTLLHHATTTNRGEAFGIVYSDQVSGDLTCCAGMLNLKEGALTLNINIRYSLTNDAQKMHTNILNTVRPLGGTLSGTSDSAPNHFPEDHPAVSALTGLYNACTGADTKPYVMGGGTYARKLPNAIAFGPGGIPGVPAMELPAGHGGAHQPDEFVSVKQLEESVRIYILAILKLNEMEL